MFYCEAQSNLPVFVVGCSKKLSQSRPSQAAHKIKNIYFAEEKADSLDER